MTIHFTSDTHFWHKAVIVFCNRPWGSVEEMNAGLIERWNYKVAKDDLIYILGDMFFCGTKQAQDILTQLNGRKVLIRGNHDTKIKGQLLRYFTDISPLAEISVEDVDALGGKQKIVLCHYAMRVWHHSHIGSWQLFGHSHGSMPENGTKQMDVGVDANNWYPVSYEEVKIKMQEKHVLKIDHHTPR